MEIEYGAEVVDSNGKKLGKVDYVVRDSYTGDIRKFKVDTSLAEADLFFSPEDVSEATVNTIILKNPVRTGGTARQE